MMNSFGFFLIISGVLCLSLKIDDLEKRLDKKMDNNTGKSISVTTLELRDWEKNGKRIKSIDILIFGDPVFEEDKP